MRAVCAAASVATAVLAVLAVSSPAGAATRPVVTGLSVHHGAYWGGSLITVRGRGFTGATKVRFGGATGYGLHVISDRRLTVRDPWHGYAKIHVRVVTRAGASAATRANVFTFARPTMNTPIQGGLTARQEQHISAKVRAKHRNAATAHHARRWTAAMGATALRRARSWLGVPYSWAGGSGAGPTTGVCAHNGGDLDCHVIGFDCSGLALYSWSPYKHLAHYAATQHNQAGRFHPTIGQLMPGDLVFFSGYLANGIGHVAVYQGHGMVIQAEQSGTTVMRSRLVDVIANSGRYRGAVRPMSTGRQGAIPRLTAMTAQVGVDGQAVTIRGAGLAKATSVSVGGAMVYSFTKRTATELVVKAPAHAAGRVSVTVSNAWGSAKQRLTYVGAPQISALSTSQGPAAGGNQVVVTGRNLATVTRVTVGGAAVSFAAAGSNRLTLTMPAHAPGAVPVVLSSAFGTSNTAQYRYLAPTPTPMPTSTTAGAARSNG
ncbi:IPT/TIG domain-containing protein [uncultured Jatrophihabitans sp.]|uniref:IPT/TIG domain-containing protein n=1 Tax=uncultured Jatrophihabitans sp. TaxID=1610747 RepID=UPI0035C9A219